MEGWAAPPDTAVPDTAIPDAASPDTASPDTGGNVVSLIVPAHLEYPVATEKDVPMTTRDGVTLYSEIVRPDAPGRFPVLLSRTPYGKGGSSDPNGPNTFFARYGYVSVTQDCRGRWPRRGTTTP